MKQQSPVSTILLGKSGQTTKGGSLFGNRFRILSKTARPWRAEMLSLLLVGQGLLDLAASAQTLPQLSIAGLADGLQLNVLGDPAISYRIEASTDLQHWEPFVITYP